MRRLTTAALVGASLLLGGTGTATANNGPCTFGMGCGGMCLRFFPHIHQHGPLFNYGPYYGYPPFEPYGYWNSYLQYTGPVPINPGPGAGAYGWIGGGLGGHHLFHGGRAGQGCAHCGAKHAHTHKGGCSTCGSAAAAYVSSGDAATRYTGVGHPAASAAYYAETPALLAPAEIVPVAFPGH